MSVKDVKRKLTAKDVIIDRLEGKLAKSDLVCLSLLHYYACDKFH